MTTNPYIEVLRKIPGSGYRIVMQLDGYPGPQHEAMTVIPLEDMYGLFHQPVSRADAKTWCPDLDRAPCTYPHCHCTFNDRR